MKKTFYILSINLSILLALIFSIEGLTRVFVPKETIAPIFGDQKLRTRKRPFVELHETRGFALKPGFSNGFYTVNSDGFRGEEIPLSSGKKIILALGESTTFGWGVRNDETYPAYLSGYFPKEDGVCVINGGVPSYTSSQVRVTLEEILAGDKVKPDLVLISILWNDIWYSTIKNWHKDMLIYQKQPGWLTFLTDHSRFCHAFVVGFVKKKKQTNVFNPKALAQYGRNIQQMIEICGEKGVQLAFVAPPFDADHMPEKGLNEFHVGYTRDFFIQTAQTYDRQLQAIAETKKVPMIAHGLDIRNLHQKPLFQDALHPTAQGNAIMARDIYHSIRDQNLLKF